MRDGAMKAMYRTAIAVFLLFVAAMPEVHAVEDPRCDFYSQNQMTSHMMMNLFFEQIDNGALVVFKKKITREMIEPTKIAYVYAFNDEELTISIYSKLKKQLVIPHFENFLVDGIRIDVDEKGNIKEVQSHVITK